MWWGEEEERLNIKHQGRCENLMRRVCFNFSSHVMMQRNVHASTFMLRVIWGRLIVVDDFFGSAFYIETNSSFNERKLFIMHYGSHVAEV